MQSNARLEKKPQYDYVMKTDDKEIVMTKCTDEKDLGVVFDGQLRFDKHIHLFTAKANRMLGLVKRAFPYMDADTFTKLFKSLVRPHLEYGNAIWHPLLKQQSIAVEKVQRRGTKLLAGLRNLPYNERLVALNLPSLKFRRLRGDLIQAYKIMKNVDQSWMLKVCFKCRSMIEQGILLTKFLFSATELIYVKTVSVIELHLIGIDYLHMFRMLKMLTNLKTSSNR